MTTSPIGPRDTTTMTVGQLVEALRECPPAARVWIDAAPRTVGRQTVTVIVAGATDEESRMIGWEQD